MPSETKTMSINYADAAQAKSEGMKLMTHDTLIPYDNESFIISV